MAVEANRLADDWRAVQAARILVDASQQQAAAATYRTAHVVLVPGIALSVWLVLVQ